MNILEAKEITGSLSKPSKMPGWSYGLPAKECKTGGKLTKC
jgi:molybdenum-dependent DNA-binding transcriptional regulator ModE